MRRFTEQDDAGIANGIDDRRDVVRIVAVAAHERNGVAAEGVEVGHARASRMTHAILTAGALLSRSCKALLYSVLQGTAVLGTWYD